MDFYYKDRNELYSPDKSKPLADMPFRIASANDI